MESLPNEEAMIKNYEVVRVLGQGSFGKVFLIRNIHTNVQYAMKKYSYYFLKKNGKDLSLQRSVKILQSLNHKYILKIAKYIITNDDSIYLIFQACKKGSLQSLKELLYNSKAEYLIDFVLFQLIEGLKYLKQASVAHRDLKPSNIAFTSSGDLKIIDFDQAVCFNSNYLKDQKFMKLPQFPQVSQCPIFVSRRSRAMSFVGTQIYMCPQMKTKTQSDQRGDIWALGCIIYQLLMNEQFFIDTQDQKQLHQEIKNKLQVVKQKNTSFHSRYVQLLSKILTVNPNERISIQDIYHHSIFQKLRTDYLFFEKAQRKFNKLLKRNQSIADPNTLFDALKVDLIGMKPGKQFFQYLKTAVLIKTQFAYDMMYLIGGGQYFKLRDIQDQMKKMYIRYDQIQSIKIVQNMIIIKIQVRFVRILDIKLEPQQIKQEKLVNKAKTHLLGSENTRQII